VKTHPATRKQQAYLEGIQGQLDAELITAATFKACGCVTAEIGGVIRALLCKRCESHRKHTKRLSSAIPRSCYCGDVDIWTGMTSQAFRNRDPEAVEKFRKLRTEHSCDSDFFGNPTFVCGSFTDEV